MTREYCCMQGPPCVSPVRFLSYTIIYRVFMLFLAWKQLYSSSVWSKQKQVSSYESRRSSDQRRNCQRHLCWQYHRSDLKVTPYVSSRLVRCQQGSWSSSRVSLAPRGGMSHQCHVFSGSLPTNVTPTSQVVDVQSSRQRITIHTFNTFTTISI